MKSLKGLLILFLLLTGLFYYNSCDETVTNQIIANLITHGWIVGDSLNGYGYILRTSDAGDTWTRQGDSSMLANISLTNLAVIDKQTVWIVGKKGTIILTTNSGESWQKQVTPPTDLTDDLSSISAIDRNIAWISGGSLVLHTVNAGSTWNRVIISGAPTGINLQGICAADVNNIWAVGQGNSGSEGYIYYSSDAGINWNRIIPSVMPPDSATWIGVKALSVNNVWIHGGVGKLIHTTDSGQTWTHVPTPLEGSTIGSDLNDMSFYNANTGYFACDQNHIIHTTNAGANWSLFIVPSSNEFLVGVHTISPSTAWFVGQSASYYQEGKVVYTTNSGADWNLKMLINNDLSKIAFVK